VRKKQGSSFKITGRKSKRMMFNSPQIKFVCISDTHSRISAADIPRIPMGDVLLHAGDFTMYGTAKEIKDFNELIGK